MTTDDARDRPASWRLARPEEDELIVGMCLELNREDPGDRPVSREQIERTLAVLRAEPARGRAVVLDLGGRIAGYALLISFWSNELGGEVCEVDELYVAPSDRSRGHAQALFLGIERGAAWPPGAVAIGLGVAPANTRARRLYERV